MTWPILPDRLLVSTVLGRTLVVDRASGYVRVVDDIGALVLAERNNFDNVDGAALALHDVLGGDIATIRSELDAFERQLAVLPAPPVWSVSTTDSLAAERSVPSTDPCRMWRVSALGAGVEIRVHSSELIAVVESMVGSLPSAALSEHRFDIWRDGVGISIARDGRIICDSVDRSLAVSRLLGGLTQIAWSAPTPHLLLHAAGAATDGRAILLCGESNQGKSSTMVELMRRGMAYLSDEVIELDPESGGLRGLARPIGLEGTMRERHADLRPPWWPDDPWYQRWPVAPTDLGGVVESARVVSIVFLEYTMVTGSEAERLDPLRSLARLCSYSFNPEVITPTVLQHLGDLLRRVPSIVLRHGGSPHAAAALAQLGATG